MILKVIKSQVINMCTHSAREGLFNPVINPKFHAKFHLSTMFCLTPSHCLWSFWMWYGEKNVLKRLRRSKSLRRQSKGNQNDMLCTHYFLKLNWFLNSQVPKTNKKSNESNRACVKQGLYVTECGMLHWADSWWLETKSL